MSNGLDTNLDQLEGRKRNISTQLSIINTIQQAISQDQTVNSNRENAKTVLAAAVNDAAALDGYGLQDGDRQLFIDQVDGVRNSLN